MYVTWCMAVTLNQLILYNCHCLEREDPLLSTEKMHNLNEISVWCRTTSDKIVGTVNLHNTINAKRYLTTLREEVWPIISP